MVDKNSIKVKSQMALAVAKIILWSSSLAMTSHQELGAVWTILRV